MKLLFGHLLFPKKFGPRLINHKKFSVPKHSTKLNVWLGISYQGITKLNILTENLTGELSGKIINEALIPSIKKLFKTSSYFVV